MQCKLYSNTLFCPKVPSAQGYMIAQIFTTNFSWSQSSACHPRAKPMLYLVFFFAQEGLPPKMIVDCAKKMRLGEFAQKCKEATCYLQGTETYSPWSNFAEHEIRELKKDAARKLTQSGAPRQLWCFALEYKSYVHSHALHMTSIN